MSAGGDQGGPVCREIVERLVDGASGAPSAGDASAAGGASLELDVDVDGDIARHVGSCLACFRALTELREVPRVAALLRRQAAARAEAAEPGPTFWDGLAARTVDAALAARTAGVAAGAPAPAPGVRAETAGAERRPWLAALLGATAAAAALMWLFFGHPSGAPERAAAPLEEAALAGESGLPAVTATAGALPAPASAVFESLDDLELDGPATDLAVDVAVDVASIDAPEMVEQIAGLEEPALRRLAQSLARTAL